MTRARFVLTLLLLTASAFASTEPPPLTIRLAPGGVGDDGNPSWIDVSSTFPVDGIAALEPFLRTPVKFAGVDAVAYGIDDLNVVDDSGPVPLVENVDDPDAGGFLYWRRWSASRDVEGKVVVRYRAPIALMIPKLGAGPPFDVRPQGGGLSGAFNTFLVMPDTDRAFTIDIDWDLDELAPGSIGVTSFGEGNTRAPGTSDSLIATFIMAGPLGRYPPDNTDSRFTGYWVDEPLFDAADTLAWSQRAYDVIAEFFRDTDPPPFRVFMRGNPYPGGGGSALMQSFLVSYPDTMDDATELRETIAHETVHNWVGGIGGPPGSSSWFSEGMTVYYTRELLFRSGLFTAEEFLDSVNDTATSYYTNDLNHLPNDRIAAGFWEDARIRRLPYVRGSLYFADMDRQIREQSEGRRSLDDLALAFSALRETEDVDADTWRRLVADELGADGESEFEAMLAGDLIVPPSDAFGPCFERREAMLRPFELGFEIDSPTIEPRVVKNLAPDSEAADAGVRDGDVLLAPVPLYAVQNDPELALTLEILRDDEELTIEYLPRGDAVPGYQWFLKRGLTDAGCGEIDARDP